jgi:hypothetical protein
MSRYWDRAALKNSLVPAMRGMFISPVIVISREPFAKGQRHVYPKSQKKELRIF